MRPLSGLLFPLLLVACARDTRPEAAAPPAALVLDLYDVRDLTVPIQSFPGRSGLETLDSEDPFGFEEEEGGPFDGDALADLIRETIDPEVWAAGSVVEFREGGVLIVKAPAGTHAKIARLLAGLRGATTPH